MTFLTPLRRTLGSVLAAALLLAGPAAGQAPQDAVSPTVPLTGPPVVNVDAVLRQLPDGARWLRHLEQDLLPFWDRESAYGEPRGDYPTYRCNDGSLYSAEAPCPELRAPVPGIVWLDREYTRANSRQAFAYGIAFHMTGDPRYLALARDGVNFLRETLLDPEGGAYTYIRNGEGGPARLQRTSQDLAYALTGLGFYYYLTHDPAILDDIRAVQTYIFDTYFDAALDLFVWVIEPSPDGDRPDQRELVAQLDQVYAYMLWLAQALPPEMRSEWEGHLHHLARIMIEQFYSGRQEMFWGAITEPALMQPATDHTDFGHSVKTFWLIYQIGKMTDDLMLTDFGRRNAQNILERAYIEETGSWARRIDGEGRLDADKEWWILAELDQVAATLALTDPAFARVLPKTYDYWFRYMVDQRHGGVWHWVDAATNTPDPRFPKQHSWKNALHSFEHALVGYLTGQQLHGEDITLYYAFEAEPAEDRIQPYFYQAKIKQRTRDAATKIDTVTFTSLR